MRRFELPDDWEQVPALQERVQEHVSAGRYGTAMEEVLRHLRHDPSSTAAFYLAITIASTSRTELVASPDPLTPAQRASALLAPIMTECSECRSRWCSTHVLLPGLRFAGLDPAGSQCQECRYTRCSDCFPFEPSQITPHIVDSPCPKPGCPGTMTLPVLPTGRHDVMDVEPDDIERVIVVRDGPVTPTMDEALTVVTRFVPLWTDDTPLIGIRRGRPGMMNDRPARDRLAARLVHAMERDGELAPGAWERARPLFIKAGGADDTDYLLTVIKRPAPAHDPAWGRYIADLMREHVRRMAGVVSTAGACWAGLGSEAMVGATAELLHQALGEARRTHRLATRTCAIPGYAIAATVVLTADITAARDTFGGRYGDFCMTLYNAQCAQDGERDRQTFVHWIMSTDDSMIKLDATVFPADGNETAMLAVDLMSPAERAQLGL
ncbi:MAG TPA: hypothetical protein VF069_14880 [Streptosporangiaceae bacterium]